MPTSQAIQETHEGWKVSFIVTAYNLPTAMLHDCIGSILRLSLRPDEREIIVVDDGSEPSPMKDLQPYADDILFVRQRNMGLSAARNTGLRMASGRFVQFVDGDDMLLPAAYEHCLRLAWQQATDMVLFRLTSSAQAAADYTDLPPTSGCHHMQHSNIRGTACGYLFRRAILGALRFTPGIYHEDEEFTPQLLLRAETVRITTAQAYFYRRREDSITTSRNRLDVEKRLDDTAGIIGRLHTLANRLPMPERNALQRRVAQLTMDYLYHVITETRSRRCLEERVDALAATGLFPLPDQPYTRKYQWFRRMAKTAAGRRVLLATLPHIHRRP